MSSLAKIPVTVITGFLGSGKTTLIRHLMSESAAARSSRCWSTSSAAKASTATS